MNKQHHSNSESDKHREIIKQQLLAMANSKSATTSSKVLSADSMIEDLLSKKETFQRKDVKNSQNIAAWLIPGSGTVHPLYERIWAGVQSSNPQLADTPRLSALLLTSGLPTDVLGFIWSLANQTVAGALTQQEVYVVLALVALAQSGYAITTPVILNQLPQPPLPKLDFAMISLPTVSSVTATPSISATPPIVYPQQSTAVSNIAPLSASSLLDTKTSSKISATPAVSNLTTNNSKAENPVTMQPKEIGISYVSNHILPPQVQVPQVNFAGTSSIYPGTENIHLNTSHDPEPSLGYVGFDSLTSQLSTLSVQEKQTKEDDFDDDFSDFQTADFKQEQTSVSLIEDEFSNFQSVTIDPDVFSKNELHHPTALYSIPTIPLDNRRKDLSTENSSKPFSSPEIISKSDEVNHQSQISNQTTLDASSVDNADKYNIFHNPLPELLEDKYSVFASLSNESKDDLVFSDFIESAVKDKDSPSVLELPKIKSFDEPSEVDDDYSDFHSFDFTNANSNVDNKTDQSVHVESKTVINTIVNPLTSILDSEFNIFESADKLAALQINVFQQNTDNDKHPSAPKDDDEFADFQTNLFSSGAPVMDVKVEESLEFDDFVSASVDESTHNMQNDCTADKYSALRVLEPAIEDAVDDFGDFVEAEVKETVEKDERNIQILCLDACLTLLKEGVTQFSSISNPEVLEEVLSDSRTSHYLDCLQEVFKVSERILANIDTQSVEKQRTDLELVKETLLPYLSHSQHIVMEEVKGTVCGICHSDTGPSPIKYGLCTFHAPCANLYLHCIDTVLPNITSVR